MQYRTGLLIGRFQPFHNGHLHIITEALKQVQNLIIGIGSSNVRDEENPFDFKTRKNFLEAVFEKESLQDKLVSIIPIPDVPDDDKWLKIVRQAAGEFDVGIGNNEWTNGIFEKAQIPVVRIPYHRRDIYEGKKIRERIKRGESLDDVIPSYIDVYNLRKF